MMLRDCPSCHRDALAPFYRAGDVPVHSTLLMRSREQAVDFPRGSLELAVCHACGFVTNTAFEQGRHRYSVDCEESQGCSPTFSQWLQDLAQRLVDAHNIRRQTVLEIGCGKGEFLAALCQAGDNHGIGYDPAYVGGRFQQLVAGSVEFIDAFWDQSKGTHDADVVACRHTLEHIPDVGQFLEQLRNALREHPNTLVFFEVPDVLRVLQHCAFWDIYYEHCSYFTAQSLQHLFRRSGFEVLECWLEYDEQYIMLLAKPTGSSKLPGDSAQAEVDAASHFRDHWQQQSDHWQALLQRSYQLSKRIVLWGGGSKAVAFLTRIEGSDAIKQVVDINPHKQGAYMPGTGQCVIAPEALTLSPPDIVIVVNPVYRPEIADTLSKLGLAPEILCLEG